MDDEDRVEFKEVIENWFVDVNPDDLVRPKRLPMPTDNTIEEKT